MTEIDKILEKVRTHYALLPSDKTGLEPWDEMTIKEASKALQDLILKEKIAELENTVSLVFDLPDMSAWEVPRGTTVLIEKRLMDRKAELQNQLKEGVNG